MPFALYKKTYFGPGANGRIGPLVHIMLAAGIMGYALSYDHLLRKLYFHLFRFSHDSDEYKKDPFPWSQYYVQKDGSNNNNHH